MASVSQWTLTKRHTDTRALLGSQNSTTQDFYCWKSRDFASICLRKGAASLQFSKHALTSPHQFHPGTSNHDTQAHRTFTSFSGSLKFPDFITHNALWQPGHRTGSPEAPLLTTAWGQPAAWEITTNTLIYSNKICKQPCTCVCTEHTFMVKPGGTDRRNVYCHSYKLFPEHCVFKLSTSQKLAEMGSSHPHQLNFYLTMGFQSIPGMKVQH